MKNPGKVVLRFLLFFIITINVIIAFHAYKFTHFYEPGEVQKLEPSTASAWEKTKSILFGFNSIKQKNTAPDTAAETLTLITSDGLRLESWFMKASNPKGTVALFHGHGSKKSSILAEASVFRKLGYSTMLTDFRAHGSSEGHTCTIGYKESRDVKAAYDYLTNLGEKHIILYGISLGSATITRAIHEFKIAPEKVILDMPFASLPDAVRSRVSMMHLPPEPISTLLSFWGSIENGFWAFGMKPYVYARDIRCPVLLQRGLLDNRVSQDETDSIFSNIRGPKKLVIFDNSGHQSLCSNEPVKWQQEVAGFLR